MQLIANVTLKKLIDVFYNINTIEIENNWKKLVQELGWYTAG